MIIILQKEKKKSKIKVLSNKIIITNDDDDDYNPKYICSGKTKRITSSNECCLMREKHYRIEMDPEI